jgi:hypothetical protein
MLRRLITGLVLGLIAGSLLAAALVGGLKVETFEGAGGVALAYLSAALTGVTTGLVTGKPIWAAGAKVEAGLKAFFGALLGAGVMFALRRWATWAIDLSFMGGGGPAALYALPAASLPLIAALLGGFFELDNTVEKNESRSPIARKRVAGDGVNGKAKPPAAVAEDAGGGAEAEVGSRRAKR